MECAGVTREWVGSLSQDLQFDNSGRLWVLAANRLYAPDNVNAVERRCVASLDRSKSAAAWIEASQPDGAPRIVTTCECEPINWPLKSQSNPSVWKANSALFASAEGPVGFGRRSFELAFRTFPGGKWRKLFSGVVGDWLGASQVKWIPIDMGAIILVEKDEHSKLFLCRPDVAPLQISPDGFEIKDFDVNTLDGRIAMVASPFGQSDGTGECWLLVAQVLFPRCLSDYKIVKGVNRQPRWSDKGKRLSWLTTHDRQSGEAVSVCAASIPDLPTPLRPKVLQPISNAPYLEMAQTNVSAAVMYVQGPHRQFYYGPQDLLFHQAIASLLRDLAESGIGVMVINGPGSIGAGRLRREVSEPWSAALAKELDVTLRVLQEQGVERIGILSGSLGSIPLVEFIASNPVDAAVMIAPVLDGSAQILRPWAQLFAEPIATHAMAYAPRIQTPLLTIQGDQDEMSRVIATSLFVSAIPEHIHCEYMTVEGEGHIFARPESWTTLLARAKTFIEARLIPSAACLANAVKDTE